MRKGEMSFLKALTVESLCFLVLSCIGMAVFPRVAAQNKDSGKPMQDLAWKGYFVAKEALEAMLLEKKEEVEEEDYQEKLLAGERSFFEKDAVYIDKAKLEKKKDIPDSLQPEELGRTYIRIRKSDKAGVPGRLEHDYQQKKVLAVFYGEAWKKLEKTDIQLFWKGRKYEAEEMEKAPISLHSFHCQENIVNPANTEKKEYSALFEFDANQIFCYDLRQDKEYVYIKISKPKQAYDKVVVVDAGHGGIDTGTYASHGGMDEKDFNFDFARKLGECWEHENVKLYFSRTEDKKIPLEDRVSFANRLRADLFVSFHCNSSDEDGGDGVEILYKENQFREESKAIAEGCLDALAEATDLKGRGLLNGNSIYVVRNAKMPAILIEAGFLSDQGDLDYLLKEENRKAIAKAVGEAIWDWMGTTFHLNG